tara:strand:+ start:5483 stop:5593 length:111 start_codon:yes stop_codon:yes gene_type:complete
MKNNAYHAISSSLAIKAMAINGKWDPSWICTKGGII